MIFVPDPVEEEKPRLRFVPDEPKEKTTSFGAGFLSGAREPIDAMAQMLNEGVKSVAPGFAAKLEEWTGSPSAQQATESARKSTAQAFGADEGSTGGRIAGNVITSIASLPRAAAMLPQALRTRIAGGAAASPARQYVGRVATGAAAGGAAAPLTQTVDTPSDSFWADKGDQAKTGAMFGGAIPAAVPAIGGVLRQTLGMGTGAGGESIRQAYRAGREGIEDFVANMRGNVGGGGLVDRARAAVQRMRQDMGRAYATGKGGGAGWADDTSVLSPAPIRQAMQQADDAFSFGGIPNPGIEGVQRDVRRVVDQWLTAAETNPRHLTVEGFDALKKHIASIYPDNVANRTGRAYVTQVSRAVRDSIIQQRPQYAQSMSNYGAATDELDEIAKALSLGDKASVDTALRKLTSVMRNNVNANFGERLRGVGTLATEGGDDLLPGIAGQALNSWMPRGLQAAGVTLGSMANPSLLPLATLTSPRLMGEAAHAAGQGARAMSALPGGGALSTTMTINSLLRALEDERRKNNQEQ